MESSDSDAESECFESAEESFDEKEGIKDEKVKSQNLKPEDEASIPVVSDCNSMELVCSLENASSGSRSYRKRPERVKRLPHRTSKNPIPQSHRNELILKPDKIVPDVFLQDITSNLSKNINKSLNTIQQTSCNVKDLIFNALPVSSVSDSETFSYDDKTVSFANENKLLSIEAGHLNSGVATVESQENIIKERVKNKEIFENEVSNESFTGKGSESNNKRISEGDTKNNLRKKDLLFKDIFAKDDFENEAISFKEENLENCNKACLASDALKIPEGNNCSETVTNFSKKAQEIIHDFNDTSLKHEKYEISGKQEETKNKDTDLIHSANFEEEIDQESKICKRNEKICSEFKVNLKVKKEEEILEPNKFLGLIEKDSNENNFSMVHSDEKNFDTVMKESNKINTAECNLEGLKTAPKNFVKEETISTKRSITLDVKLEVNQDSNEGWDDFDFSDDEIEKCQSDNKKNFQDNKTSDELTKNKSPLLDKKLVKGDMEIETKKLRNLILSEEKFTKVSVTTQSLSENPANRKNLIISERHDNNEENCEKAENPKKPIETNIVENEFWGWDSWDEIPENKEVEVPPAEKSELKEVNDNSVNISEWSGWDSLGKKPQEKQDNWSLGSWGVDMLLHKATAVTQGISSVLEAGLGAPDPETLARMEKTERGNLLVSEKEVVDNENGCHGEIPKKNSLTNVNIFPVSGITSLVAGVTSKIVEHSKIQEIGSKVITGGLETLETFGKKTMEVLQEGDPGLKNKRALLLGNSKPILSQVLKEAREKADRESKKVEEKELAKKCHFETLFDDFQGMVHLEALEMLSRQCELKLDQIRSGMNSEEQEDLNGILEEVEQLCSLDEYETNMKSSVLDFKALLQMAVEPLKNEVSIQNIVQIHEDVSKWLQMSSETEPSSTVIIQKFVSTLAELTAAIVHQFHKSGELLSVKECRKTVEEVDALSRLTNALCSEINKLGERFIELSYSGRSKSISDDTVKTINEKVNNVMKNSIFYIKQAFDLLIPVIQLGAAV